MQLEAMKILVATLSVFVACELAFGEPPNGSLEVTYQQLQDGKLSDSYHQITLSCFDGACALETVTFNQCWDLSLPPNNKPSKAFFIKVENQSTRDGSLKITSSTDNALTLNQTWNGANITYRFEYKTESNAFKKALYGVRRDVWFAGITDFSGAAIKSSDISKEVLSWRLAPVRSDSSIPYAQVQTSCAVQVSAIPKSDKK
jgi:hypothetical protein